MSRARYILNVADTVTAQLGSLKHQPVLHSVAGVVCVVGTSSASAPFSTKKRKRASASANARSDDDSDDDDDDEDDDDDDSDDDSDSDSDSDSDDVACDEHFAENTVCQRCNVPLILVHHESHVACPLCGETSTFFDATSSVMAYGDGVEFPTFNYKRSGHLDERLGQMQGRERKIVHDDEIQRIMTECRRRNLHVGDITRLKLQEVMKSLKMRVLYKHTTQLLSRLTGRAPPRMSPEEEEICRRMFMAMQAPFEAHKPKKRRNFLSYAFCMYKICELRGYTRFLPHFSLLKGRRKLLEQDEIWEKICGDLDWEFVRSTQATTGFHANREIDLDAMERRRNRIFVTAATTTTAAATTTAATTATAATTTTTTAVATKD